MGERYFDDEQEISPQGLALLLCYAGCLRTCFEIKKVIRVKRKSLVWQGNWCLSSSRVFEARRS